MHRSVDAQSALAAKFEIRVSPSAIDAIMAARCEMDLSPGNATSPISETAGLTVIFAINRIGRPVLTQPALNLYLTKHTRVTAIKEIELPSRIESVEEAATAGDEFAKSCGCGDEILYAIDLAIRESVANAVKHGNKFDESKPVALTLSDSSEAFEITVRDYGSGFSVDDVPDPTDPENLLKTNGRGILFMNSFMDEIQWANPQGGGLEVKMLKKK